MEITLRYCGSDEWIGILERGNVRDGTIEIYRTRTHHESPEEALHEVREWMAENK